MTRLIALQLLQMAVVLVVAPLLGGAAPTLNTISAPTYLLLAEGLLTGLVLIALRALPAFGGRRSPPSGPAAYRRSPRGCSTAASPTAIRCG
jgi:hypothetical protein